MDDEGIVELYWQRSEQAIVETSAKYEKYCYSIAHGILNNSQDAEEIVNDTYSEAWNTIPPHRPSVLSAFSGKITRRLSIDKFRHRNAAKRGGGEMPVVLDELQDCIASDEDIEQEYEKKRLNKVVNAFVSSLPEAEQKVFMCRYWYMDSIEVICKQFDFSERKVKSMLYRTREELRDLLVKEGFQ